MPAIKNALVIGAGISGLTTAIALRRQGIEVDVVEIAPSMSVYGVGIIQPNNTLRALDQIGLAKSCVEAGAPFPGWQLFDAGGVLLFEVETSSDAAPYFPPNNGITRPTLHRILTGAALQAGSKLRFGTSTVSIQDSSDGVAVKFTDGKAGRYDLLVGCDGLNSQVRQHVFGNGCKPELTGQGVWRYNLPRPADLNWGRVYESSSCKVGFVPLSPTLMYMLVVTAERGNPRFAGSSMAQEMRDRLVGIPGLVAEMAPLIVDPEAVVYRPLETVFLPAPWMRGNVVLIGDAAHSMTPHLGQGAAMAIEDAVLLGELLGRNKPVPTLLEEFMRRRFDRVRLAYEAALQLGRWEMDAWAGRVDPEANPGALIYGATQSLMKTY